MGHCETTLSQPASFIWEWFTLQSTVTAHRNLQDYAIIPQCPFCFLEFLQIFRACNFLNQCLPLQITCHTSSYLSVLLNIGIFNFITCPWARAGRGSYFLLNVPTFSAKISLLLKHKSIPRSLVRLPTSL